jgi:hypothetical protein
MDLAALIKIPLIIIVLLAYFPIYNLLAGSLFPVIDAGSNILFGGIIKLIVGIIPLAIIIVFLWKVVDAITTPSMPRPMGL